MRVAASACLVTAGLSLTGLGGAMALADSTDGPGSVADADPAVDRDQATPDPEGTKTQGAQTDPEPGDDEDPETGDPDDGATTGVPVETGAEQSPTPTKSSTASSTPCPTTTDPSSTSPTPTSEPAPGDNGGGGDSPGGFFPPRLDGPEPVTPSVVDVAPGLPAVAPMAPISVPVIVVPPMALPGGLGMGSSGPGGGGAGPRAGAPEAPPGSAPAQAPLRRQPEAPNPVREPAAVPANFRIGYGEYLRTAGVAQIAAVAVPGTAGILVLTGLGGLVGYRQAKAGRAVRTEGIARFMN